MTNVASRLKVGGGTAKVVRPPTGRRRGFRVWRNRGGISAIVLALPAVAVFSYFAWIPIGRGIVMSFQSNNFVSDRHWVGLGNFTYVLNDPLLATALLNTAYFTALALVMGFPVPLFLAVFIGELRRRRGLYSVLAYLPVVVPPVAAILLWQTFYDPSSTGLLNTIFGAVGLGPFPWLDSTTTVMPSIVLEAVWAGAGGTTIIYLAALGTIRTELYEAAELDGAGIWHRIWHITLPQLRGIVLIMLLLQVIGTMQVFTEPYVFTGGGPGNASVTILILVFRYAFIDVDYGAATALSVMLAILLAAVSGIYQFATRGWSSK